MQTQSTHPALLAAITLIRSLNEERVQQLISALASEHISLTSGALQVRHLLNFPAADIQALINVLRQWHAWNKDLPALITTLQAIHATSTAIQTEVPAIHLVWTGPVSLPGPTRTTEGTLLDMITHARQEIVIVGYTLAETARSIVEHLAHAHQRGVQIIMIIDRMEENGLLDRLQRFWPSTQKLPFLYTRPAPAPDSKSALHAKAIIVDSQTILATSANLSYQGMAGNIELGLLVTGPVAQEAVSLLKALITEGICIRITSEEEREEC